MKHVGFLVYVCLLFTGRSLCQERPIQYPAEEVSLNFDAPKEVIANMLRALSKVRNVQYISEVKAGIPFMPHAFLDPYVANSVVSFNEKDTIQRASFKFYVLRDSFRLQMAYDGKYLVRVDAEMNKTQVIDLSREPSAANRVLGPLHNRVRTILENAVKGNADIKVTRSIDTVKLEVTFNNLYIECMATNTPVAKDTVGFVSKYVIYIDGSSYLPVRCIRDMPHHTTIETILYQQVNFIDTLALSAIDSSYQYDLVNDVSPLNVDSLFVEKFTGTVMIDWKLCDVEGDSVQFSTIKGKNCVLAFNSVGWRQCEEAVLFLSQLRSNYGDECEIISIETIITNVDVLKKYKDSRRIGYFLLIADDFIKNRYRVSRIPVFLIIDSNAVIRRIVTGFDKDETPALVRRTLEEL